MTRVTLQLIADELGVSKFAVSRALTGKPGVSEQTRRDVVAAAQRLGYVAQRRGAAETRAIEVLFHDRNVANRELWVDVQQGVQIEAAQSGFSMAVRWTNDHEIVSRLEGSTAGFVLIGPHEPEMYEAARASRVPAVIVSHVVPPLSTIDQITATDVEAGVYVAEFLAGLGHRRMAYVHGQLGYPGRIARLRGFARAIEGIEGAELREMSFADDRAPSEFRDALVRLLDEGFEPSAFFCGSDGVAVTVVSELMRMGLRVPGDISVVGHADYPIATQVSPKLTTVHMPHLQMGVAAVRTVLARAGFTNHLNDLPPQRISLVPHLVVRDSSGPAAAQSWRGRLG